MNQRDVILICGQTGSGKSFEAQRRARAYTRVLVASASWQDYPFIPRAESFDHLLDLLTSCRAFAGCPFRWQYAFEPEERNLAFKTAEALGDCLLILEEAHRFDFKQCPNYESVVFEGRHLGVGLLLSTPHANDVPTDVRRELTEVLSFKQILPDDVDWLRKVVGDAALELPKLKGPPTEPPNPYLHWSSTSEAKIIYPAKKNLDKKTSIC